MSETVRFSVGAGSGDQLAALALEFAARATEVLEPSRPAEVSQGLYASAMCLRAMVAAVCEVSNADDNDILLGVGHGLGQVVALLPDPAHRAALLYAVCNAMAQTMVANSQVHDHVGGTQ